MSNTGLPQVPFLELRRRRPILLALAALLLLALGLLAVVVRGGPLGIDLAASTALQPLGGPWDAIFGAFNVAGAALIWDPAMTLLAGVFAFRGRRRDAVILLGALVMAEAATSAVKLVVDRARPPGSAVFDLITQASFPSGHVARTVVTLGVLVVIVGARRPSLRTAAAGLAVVSSIVMGAARIWSGEHWFSDVVGAALLALLVHVVVALLAPIVGERLPGRTFFGGPAQP